MVIVILTSSNNINGTTTTTTNNNNNDNNNNNNNNNNNDNNNSAGGAPCGPPTVGEDEDILVTCREVLSPKLMLGIGASKTILTTRPPGAHASARRRGTLEQHINTI